MYPFPYLVQSALPCPVLTVASLTCMQVSQEAGKVVWYSHLFKNLLHVVVIHAVKGFGVVNEQMFFWNSFAYSMIQWMLAIWSLVPLPFLNPAWTSGIFQFTYCWSLTWRIIDNNKASHFTSVWDECSCAVAWTFFGIAFLWDWNENWPFPVLWPLLSFPNLLLAYWVQQSTLECYSTCNWLLQVLTWNQKEKDLNPSFVIY